MFQIGDKVRCINVDGYPGEHSRLEKDKIYTVFRLNFGNICVEGNPLSFDTERFELVETFSLFGDFGFINVFNTEEEALNFANTFAEDYKNLYIAKNTRRLERKVSWT